MRARVAVAAAQDAPAVPPASQPASQPVIERWRFGADDAPTSAPASQPAEEPERVALVPRAPRGPFFRFDELSLELGFEAELSSRQVNSSTGAGWGSLNRPYNQYNQYQRYEETLGVKAAGSIWDDSFLRYSFSIRGGLSQEAQIESGPGFNLRDFPNGQVLEYDAKATLFPSGKITANFFAQQTQGRVPQLFLPTLQANRERYGVELTYNDAILPMRLLFDQSYESLVSPTASLQENEQNWDHRLEYDVTWQPSEYHSLNLNYQYDARSERYSGTRTEYNTTGNYLTLNHTLQFGADHRSRLDTVVRLQDEAGDLARDIYEIAPQLRLQHTDALASIYRFQWMRQSFEGADVDMFRGDAGVAWQPTDWFNAGVNFYGLTENANQGADITEWGAVLTAGINHENPWGRFTGNATYNYSWQQLDNGGGDGVVLNETVTFNDPLTVFLAHTDVKPSTILVTDAERRRVYLAGRDYTIIQIGRYTALARVPTGQIANKQTVRVSYLYEFAQNARISTNRFDLRLQQAFTSGWVPYYATTLQGQDVSTTRVLGYLPQNINRQRVGLDFRQPRWTVGGELEYYDNSYDPYEAIHVRGEATLFDQAPHNLSLRSSFSYYHFFNDQQGTIYEPDAGAALANWLVYGSNYYNQSHDASILDVALAYRGLIVANLEANATAAYRFENDTLYGITNGVDVSGSLNWRIGLLTAIFEIEYNQLNLPGTSDGGVTFWVKLKREIPLIGGPLR